MQTKPPPPPKQRRTISQINMAAVSLTPLTEDEASELTLFVFPGANDYQVAMRSGYSAIPINSAHEGTQWAGEPELLTTDGKFLPMAHAMLLVDPFQSEVGHPTIITPGDTNELLFDLAIEVAFPEHYELSGSQTMPPPTGKRTS